jgi:hypothetical protein
MLSVVMPSVIMLIVVMPSVAAPSQQHYFIPSGPWAGQKKLFSAVKKSSELQAGCLEKQPWHGNKRVSLLLPLTVVKSFVGLARPEVRIRVFSANIKD